jgi:hypothetical protein
MKLVFIFFLAILSVANAKAQVSVYKPFPDSNAIWNIRIGNGGTGPWSVSDISYKLTGKDTLILGQIYKVIQDKFGNYISAIRQDIPNKKVYGILDILNPSDILLYDFNLQIGDTFRSRPLVNCDSITVIDALDSIQINGQYRKVLKSGNIDIIEGIGSNDGLFEHNCFETSSVLCKFENGLNFYNINCTPLSTTDNEMTLDEIVVSNNRIYLPETYLGGDIKLLNQQLQIVASIRNIKNEIINLDFLTSGIYFVVYKSKKINVVKKIALTH